MCCYAASAEGDCYHHREGSLGGEQDSEQCGRILPENQKPIVVSQWKDSFDLRYNRKRGDNERPIMDKTAILR